MMQRFITISLITVLGTVQCVAQVMLSRPVPRVPANYWRMPPQIADWEQRAARGDMDAAYHLGRAYEAGETNPTHARDLPRALECYNLAVKGGNLNAIYRLGVLFENRAAMVKDANGTLRPDPQRGRQMVTYALQHGYDPVHDYVVPQRSAVPMRTTQNSRSNTDDGTGLLVGAAAALLALGILANAASDSSGSSSSGSGSDTSTSSKWFTCQVPRFNAVSGETTYVTGFGNECNQWGARPY